MNSCSRLYGRLTLSISGSGWGSTTETTKVSAILTHQSTRFGNLLNEAAVLPPYLRRSRLLNELITWLYLLKGISTGDFSDALQALLGKDAPGLSANVVVRLKEKWSREYEDWNRRDLSDRQYVYVWADGIHVNVRLRTKETSGNACWC